MKHLWNSYETHKTMNNMYYYSRLYKHKSTNMSQNILSNPGLKQAET